MRKIYLHEDDYCLIEILPVENYDYCKKETAKIDDFSEEHKAEGGTGFTDVYIRGENPYPTKKLNIPFPKLCKALEAVCDNFDEITGCYGLSENTFAYGVDDNVVVFADYDNKSGEIENIWLNLNIETIEQKRLAKKLFSTLSAVSEFIVVDWGWSFISKLNDEAVINTYLDEREKVFSSIDEDLKELLDSE